MYLKSLVLQGFKSFAQRVELLFPQGVTAIVGPNGSGKSNVSDAIRWVLGEQNIRSLRGAALQDVIFAGTNGRKPLGMAEVSLTLDNTKFELPLDYAEVTITRRTYRSGESEFFINRTPCRLRDIHDLLMDTGLGRGSLSMIGQGEVDVILSVRPEERRTLIEEAAGITRYRSKRRAALERLTETEADLVRVNDIIAEVTRQLEPLEKEAERASLYRELKAELDTLERQLLLHDWGSRKSAWETWEERRIEAHNLWVKAKEELARVQALRKESGDAVARIQEQVAEAQEHLSELQSRAEQSDSRYKVLSERLVGFRSDEERRMHNLKEVKEEQEELVASHSALKQQCAAQAAAVAEANQRFLAAEDNVRGQREKIEKGEAALQVLRTEALTQFQKAADAQSELRRTATASEATTQLLKRKEEELAELKRRLGSVEDERAQAQTDIDELEETRTTLSEVHEKIARGISDLEASRSECIEAGEAVSGRLATAQSQHDALHDLESSFEGFHEGVRACLRAQAPWRSDIFGAVGNLLDVAPEHEVALEIALGAATQNIIVADEESAKAAIEYLKERRAGRVTFLPLDTLRTFDPVAPQEWLTQDDEYIGIAAHLVQFDPAIRRAVEYLLGRVLVTRTLAGAVRLNRRVSHVSRVVSLEGDLVLAAGPITGGHRRRRQGPGVLSRSRRLAELGEEVEKLRAEYGRHKAQREKLEAAISKAQAERSDVEGRMQSVLKGISEQQRVRDVLRERVQALNQEVKRLEADVSEATATLARLRDEKDKAAKALGALDVHKVQQDTEVERLEQELNALRTDREALEDVRSECRAAWADTQGVLKATEAEITRAEQAMARIDEITAREEAELASLQSQVELTEREQQEAAQKAEAIRNKAKEQRAALDALRNDLRAGQATWDEWGAKDEGARDDVDSAAQGLHKIELTLERERVAYVQIEEQLHELEIEIPEDAQATQLEDADSLRKAAQSLRRRLDALGTVNLQALEEFGELKERHAFLVNQRDDLVEAKSGLDEAIADMDATSRERLQTTFEAIQKALSTVFPRLFGGGKAEIFWTDPDDPLESGIEMMVQPPGKRPQPLLTLSGGERALAASSLLFSIMTVRPSPFFVLDEIDAALDEANVERFAQLLSEYGSENQIIIITHRQGTMERVDALFGVTMERHGSSQLVSLRLGSEVSAAQ